MDISVVLITCNRPLAVFERAYHSVCNQMHLPKELIIVNAGLTILPKLNIGQVVNLPGASGSEARNYGAKFVTAEYIAFLDDDDEWLPEHLELHLRYLDENVGLVYTERTDKSTYDLYEDNIFVRNYIGPTSFVTVSKRCFELVGGFDSVFASNQEWDLWMRILQIASAVKCSSNTAIKHVSNDSISLNVKKRISGWESLLKKHHADYIRSPSAYRRVTKIFFDEMLIKRSISGMFKAVVWIVKSRLRI